MSDEQKPADKPLRPRRIVPAADTRAAATTQEQPPATAAAEPVSPKSPEPATEPKSDAGASGPASAEASRPPRSSADGSGGKRWDVRADRSERAARPARARRATRSTGAGASAPAGDGAPAADAPTAERRAPEVPRRPRRSFEGAPAEGAEPRFYGERRPHRPGSSGGRAMPGRFGVDRANAAFVDQWLSTPQRTFEDRKPSERKPGDRRPSEARREGDEQRRPRGAGQRGTDARGAERGADAPRPRRPDASASVESKLAAPPAAKLPELHETILVGLPKVSIEQKSDKSANKPKTAKEALLAKTAKSPATKEEPAKSKASVDPAWVGVDADAAVATLASAGEAAEALVEAWLAAKNHVAIAAAAASESLSGAARKAARRGAGVLKSRGIALPSVAPKTAAMSVTEEEVVEATFNPPDSRGTHSFTIAKRRGGERAHIAEIVIREGQGIVTAQSGWMSRSQIREAHQRITEQTGIAPAKVPVDWARARIAAALADNAKSGQLVPLSIERCKELIEPAPASAPAHPLAQAEAALGDADAVATMELHTEPELRGWVADATALDEVVREVTSKLGSDEVGDPARVDAVLQAALRSTVDSHFDAARRARLAARLRDAALAAQPRSEGASRAMLGAARAVEHAAQVSDLEFVRGLFQKGLAMRAQQTGGQLRARGR